MWLSRFSVPAEELSYILLRCCSDTQILDQIKLGELLNRFFGCIGIPINALVHILSKINTRFV